MQKSKIIDALKERLENLEKWREERKKSESGKKEEKADEDVCPECGGDLLFVEDNITYCKKCDQYYEEEEPK